jgi:hypothetical protein
VSARAFTDCDSTVDPMYGALQAAAQVKRTLDTAALKAKIVRIEAAVDLTNKTLAESTLTSLRTGYLHLASAVASFQDDVRKDELMKARSHFASIVSRDAATDVAGTSATFSAAQVAALGHLGNFHYFVLRNEEKLACLEAYSCTEKFPALGVQMFPAKLFSQDYQELVNEASSAADKARIEFEMARQARKDHYVDRVLAVAKATGLFAAGVVGGMFNPAFFFGSAIGAKGILEDEFRYSYKPDRPDGAVAAQKILLNAKMLEGVSAEARARRLALEAK